MKSLSHCINTDGTKLTTETDCNIQMFLFHGTADVTKQLFMKWTCKQSVKDFCGSKSWLQLFHLQYQVSAAFLYQNLWCAQYVTLYSTHILQATCCLWHIVMLPTQTFEFTKWLLALYWAKARYSIKEVMKTYELFLYADIHYFTNTWCKNVLKIAMP
jgi:hypothetical protein